MLTCIDIMLYAILDPQARAEHESDLFVKVFLSMLNAIKTTKMVTFDS